MKSLLTSQRHYFYWLFALYGLFVFRVSAQFIQKFFPVNFLPSFERWYSGALAYHWLLLSQLIIIAILTRTLKRFYTDKIQANQRLARVLIGLGIFYFSSMLLRLIAGLTFAQHHPWLGAMIPAIFHLVLASFMLLVGYFHYEFSKSDQ
jgi:hypothetical protein